MDERIDMKCDIHDGDRPSFCKEYLDNIPFNQWEFEKDVCPIIKERLELIDNEKKM